MSATDPTDTPEDPAAIADALDRGLRRVAHRPDDAILFVGGDNTSTVALGQARSAARLLRGLAGTAAERDAVYLHNMTLTDRVQAAEDERDRLAAQLADAQRVIGILLDRNGGSVTITEAEMVRVPRDRTLTSYRNDQDWNITLRVTPTTAALAGSDSPTDEGGVS